MSKEKLVIFGTGIISECVTPYFNHSRYEIIAYCCDESHITATSFNDKPLISTQIAIEKYANSNVSLFVALGYHQMNTFRKEKYEYFRKQGFSLASYVHSSVSDTAQIGFNSFIPDGSHIQTHVIIGSNTFVWPGSTIGHHSTIGDHCWITSGATIGGLVNMGDNCFLGLGAVVSDSVQLGKNTMVGAKALVSKSAKDNSVFVEQPTPRHRLTTSQFIKISTFFDS